LLMTDQDPVANEFLKVADQHSLGHFGNAATQFAGAHGPLVSRHRMVPFQRPSTTDSIASMGHGEISF